jgi:hypothetical protein
MSNVSVRWIKFLIPIICVRCDSCPRLLCSQKHQFLSLMSRMWRINVPQAVSSNVLNNIRCWSQHPSSTKSLCLIQGIWPSGSDGQVACPVQCLWQRDLWHTLLYADSRHLVTYRTRKGTHSYVRPPKVCYEPCPEFSHRLLSLKATLDSCRKTRALHCNVRSHISNISWRCH